MYRQPISGSAIRSIGHDGDVLEVELTGGSVVRYMGVPAAIYLDLLDSKAPMGTFNRLVRGVYRAQGDTGDGPPPGPAPRGSRPRGPAPKTPPVRDPNPGYDPHGHKRRQAQAPSSRSPRAIKVSR
jgi:KTSC domain